MKILLTLAIRNFLKEKTLNSLNILGLALGLIAAVLIILYADHEYGYDNFHHDVESIYRFEGKNNSDQWFSNIGMEYSRELFLGNYDEIKTHVQVNNAPRAFLGYGEKKLAENKLYRTNTGSQFFKIFNFELIEGNPQILLEEPYALVLTETTAKKYFGSKSPIGELLKFDTLSLKVTGVIKDLPTNSHLSFDLIYTDPVFYKREHFHTETYLKLVNNVNPQSVEKKIVEMDLDLNAYHKLTKVKLIPVKDIYLKSDAAFGAGGKGDLLQLTVFLAIGGLILLISITNYVNMSLAIYLGKGREIGIRKVLGESKSQIVKVFMYESLLMTLVAIPIVLIGLLITIPLFNDFLGVSLENKLLSSPIYWLAAICFILLISIITILYPATVLSNTEAHMLIKSKSAINLTGGVKYRNVLVFIQFMLLFTLGISAWFVNSQVSYLDNKDVGFEVNGVIKIANAYEIGTYENYELFKTKLLSYPQVEAVAFGPMIGDALGALAYQPEGSDEIYENLLSYGVDIDYFDVMGMEITAGDFKTILRSAESGQIVSLVNESFIKRYGWQDEPIGKKITLRPGAENELHRKVSAVFKDFHFYTLKEKITPQIISLRPDPQFVNTNILIKANSSNLQYVGKIIEDQWYEIKPNIPLEYDLMDDAVKRLYKKERQTGQISLVLSLLAIGLSILGLIGFMIYIIGLRSKEIAMRKVLGASLLQIIHTLNHKLFISIFVAALFGSALSYWLINKWLEDYAYAIEVELGVFVGAIVLVYLIVFTITAVQSYNSTRINPVLALKEE